jgi:hypothetical protein
LLAIQDEEMPLPPPQINAAPMPRRAPVGSVQSIIAPPPPPKAYAPPMQVRNISIFFGNEEQKIIMFYGAEASQEKSPAFLLI